jgi:hypothetical protein
MSNVERPDGWTEDQWRDYFGEADEFEDTTAEVISYNIVDVPEGDGTDGGGVA